MNRVDLRLYLVTDRDLLPEERTMEDMVEQAVKGGVTMVQLREKHLDTKEFIEYGLRLKKLLAPYGVPLIVNDRVDVALAIDADGIHIGQSDMPYSMARKILGPDKIIGLSVENMEQVAAANALDVDYVGISPVFSTATKTDTAAPFGLEGLREAVRISRHPSVGIGGMNLLTVREVMECGTDGIAVVSAIVASDNPAEASSLLMREIESSRVSGRSDESENYSENDKDEGSEKSLGKDSVKIGEFALIDRIREMFTLSGCVKGNYGVMNDVLLDSVNVKGIGDDCAIIPQASGKNTLVSCDLLVEGVHFVIDDFYNIRGKGITPYQLGWKSAAVNISDVAGMGGRPVATFLSIAVPSRIRNKGAKWMNEFFRGYKGISDKYGVALLGGDTTSSPDKLCINVTVLGESSYCGYSSAAHPAPDDWFAVGTKWSPYCGNSSSDCSAPAVDCECKSPDSEGRSSNAFCGKDNLPPAVLRSGACPGDLICVTGFLGNSAAGLKLVLENRNNVGACSCKSGESDILTSCFTDVGAVKDGNSSGCGTMEDAESYLINQHYMPDPRVSEGLALAAMPGIGAMMDISDGIASDLIHILEESSERLTEASSFEERSSGSKGRTTCKLRAVVDVEKIPLSEQMKEVCLKYGWDPVELAVGGGEDYELLFTCRADAKIPVPHFVIGQILESSDSDCSIEWEGGRDSYSGFSHF